jgi:hypothetical protein
MRKLGQGCFKEVAQSHTAGERRSNTLDTKNWTPNDSYRYYEENEMSYRGEEVAGVWVHLLSADF